MSGQMCWLPTLGGNGQKLLHLRTAPNQPWQPYKSFPQAIPDYVIPGGSKGWATRAKTNAGRLDFSSNCTGTCKFVCPGTEDCLKKK